MDREFIAPVVYFVIRNEGKRRIKFDLSDTSIFRRFYIYLVRETKFVSINSKNTFTKPIHIYFKNCMKKIKD